MSTAGQRLNTRSFGFGPKGSEASNGSRPNRFDSRPKRSDWSSEPKSHDRPTWTQDKRSGPKPSFRQGRGSLTGDKPTASAPYGSATKEHGARTNRKPAFFDGRPRRALSESGPFAARDRERQPKPPVTLTQESEPQDLIVYGKRPVAAVMQRAKEQGSSASVQCLHVMGQEAGLPPPLEALVKEARALGIAVRLTPAGTPFVVPDSANHQRVALTLTEVPVLDESECLASLQATKAEWSDKQGCLGLICDHVQDPQNFGGILRTAAFFGCRFVAFAKDRQAPLSSAALRASAGGAASLDLVRATNLSRLVKELKNAGLWVVATSCAPDAQHISSVPLDRPYVLIVGNEERGVRPELTQNADYSVRISGGRPMLDSLNVAVATGVLLASLNPAGCPKGTQAPEAPAPSAE